MHVASVNSDKKHVHMYSNFPDSRYKLQAIIYSTTGDVRVYWFGDIIRYESLMREGRSRSIHKLMKIWANCVSIITLTYSFNPIAYSGY